ncbi:MAG: Alpha/Beta hydrolase protein [Benjaminiella poitrasii]|nr:MAG: Alpha/Beta hydrolase protein [Benjaminiella poitrasii]KAI9470716.1 MAG: Alpha/Beta hydrolase protein [Benjaminiella poitrasii]
MSVNGINVSFEWITTKDGTSIYTKTWKPASTTPVIANLVMIHGFGEHIGRYDRLLSYFASQGIESYGYDQRGWGETGKKSTQFGNNQGYDTALNDIDAAIIKTKREGVPLFLMGHSMGGGLILNYLARNNVYKGVDLLSGAISSAPLVTLSMPISPIKYYTIRTLSAIVPSMTIRAGVDPAGISHDKAEVEKYKNDPLVHDFATLATLRSFIDAGTDIINKAKPLAKLVQIPILYSHSDADPINAFKGSSDAYELTSSIDKELKNWSGLYHELHNETMPQRQEITEYYAGWIKRHLPEHA